MYKEPIPILIDKTRKQLDELIAKYNYDLSNPEILNCSMHLDQLILKYDELLQYNKFQKKKGIAGNLSY